MHTPVLTLRAAKTHAQRECITEINRQIHHVISPQPVCPTRPPQESALRHSFQQDPAPTKETKNPVPGRVHGAIRRHNLRHMTSLGALGLGDKAIAGRKTARFGREIRCIEHGKLSWQGCGDARRWRHGRCARRLKVLTGLQDREMYGNGMGRNGVCGGADMTGAETRLEGKCWVCT
jgi:hypothetical protein